MSIIFVLYGLSLIIFFLNRIYDNRTIQLPNLKQSKKNISNNFSESVTDNTFSIQQSGDFHTH